MINTGGVNINKYDAGVGGCGMGGMDEMWICRRSLDGWAGGMGMCKKERRQANNRHEGLVEGSKDVDGNCQENICEPGTECDQGN